MLKERPVSSQTSFLCRRPNRERPIEIRPLAARDSNRSNEHRLTSVAQHLTFGFEPTLPVVAFVRPVTTRLRERIGPSSNLQLKTQQIVFADIGVIDSLYSLHGFEP